MPLYSGVHDDTLLVLLDLCSLNRVVRELCGKLCYTMAKEEKTMVQQLEPVTFDEFLSNAASIFAQIAQGGKGVLVEHDGALFSVEMKQPRTKKRGRGITSQDSLLHIIGIGASQGPTDTSTNKHRYLADAAGDLHDV